MFAYKIIFYQKDDKEREQLNEEENGAFDFKDSTSQNSGMWLDSGHMVPSLILGNCGCIFIAFNLKDKIKIENSGMLAVITRSGYCSYENDCKY